MVNKRESVRSRGATFATRPTTKIWDETPTQGNPYIASSTRCHGYDLLELMQKKSFSEVFFLIFKGELPTAEQTQLLDQLMIALINPGPRHPATRAAMNAGVGKTEITHIVPISLSILGGEHLGAGAIERCMLFFNRNRDKSPAAVASDALSSSDKPAEGDWQPLPGFGSYFGGTDHMAEQFAEALAKLPAAGKSLEWGMELAESLRPLGLSWLLTGVAAAVLTDLQLNPRLGSGIFQILSAPGLFAHGVEMYGKPITAMPFPKDEDYIIEE